MKAKRIGIIGAGPAGLAALKTALDAREFHSGEWADPVVLEAREDVGGVWLPAPASFPIVDTPSATTAVGSPPIFESRTLSQCQTRYPPTPLYDSLTTNLPHPVMAFSSFPFPPSTPLFPKASIVHSYLTAYADQVASAANPRRLREFVKTGRKVTSVRWAQKAGSDSSVNGDQGVWEVEALLEDAGESARVETYAFDLLFVCTGHYSTPNYPSEGDMPGLGAWMENGRAAHAIWYRNAESIPLLTGDGHGVFLQGPKENNSSNGGVDTHDAPTGIIPSAQERGRSEEGSDTRLEEVYEKAVADAQASEQMLHLHSSLQLRPHQQHEQSSDTATGLGRNAPNSIHAQELAGGDLGRATVLIVGSGPSGTDITADLVRAGVHRVIMASSGTPSTPPTPTISTDLSSLNICPTTRAPTVVAKPLPVRFHAHVGKPTGRVTFADGSVEDSTTFAVLATGYQVDFPFFDQRASLDNSLTGRFRLPKGVLPTPFWTNNEEGGSGELERNRRSLTNSNICVFPLARHLFPLPGFYANSSLDQKSSVGGSVPHPTSLAFLGLNVRVAPLPLVEAQARAALSAFAYCYSPQATQTQAGSNNEKKKDLDWDAEEGAIRERWDMLAAQHEDSKPVLKSDDPERDEKDGDELKKRKFIAKIWHRLPGDEQFAYRDDLDRFAFGLDHPSLSSRRWPSTEGASPHHTREWEARVYSQKDVLRSAWRALEARGDGSAEEWVRGVGSGETGRRKEGPGGDGGEVMNGEEEWVDMMERLVIWWETEGKKEDEKRMARL